MEHTTPHRPLHAWLLAARPFVVPIPGTARVEYVEENASAAVLKLTPEELERLTAIVQAPRG